jgi:hypothetical protein
VRLHSLREFSAQEPRLTGRDQNLPERQSENVKPIVGTDSCQVLHTGYHVSGRLHVRLEDGTEKEFGLGDAYIIPPGHDAWVVGDEPVVTVDMSSVTAERYAKPG